MREPVAVLIVEGVGSDRSETAIWAVGSIKVDLATQIIRSRWHSEDIASFVEAAITTLEKLAKRDDILDAAGIVPFAGFDRGKATIPRKAVQQEGRLKTFQHLNDFGFDLVHRALYPPAGNLIGMVADLQPERFESLIERLDHPVMQARAAYLMVSATRTLDHRQAANVDYWEFMRRVGCAGHSSCARNCQQIGWRQPVLGTAARISMHMEHRASTAAGRPQCRCR